MFKDDKGNGPAQVLAPVGHEIQALWREPVVFVELDSNI
jgi:hypothetical protein